MQRPPPALALLLALSACSLRTGAISPDDGGGSAADVGASDGGSRDAVMDGSPPRDSSAPDGSPDSSVVGDGSADSGPSDTGVVDTGPVDSGMADSGMVDTGPMDTGPIDTGPTCIVTDEACNGRDDDCDSMVDEAGCPSTCRRSARAGRIYLACDTNIAWSVARTTCMGMGYDLVVIDDAGENEHVRTQAVPFGGDFWIGMNDVMAEATYRWVDGRVVRAGGVDMLYTVWQPGEPDDDDGMDCIEMDPTAGDWNDVPCGETKPIVCETRLTTTTASP